MRITELLKKEGIELGVTVDSKNAAIDKLVDLMYSSGNITSKEHLKEGILAREASGTTALGEGIAIPHTKHDSVKKAGLAAMTVPAGVDYDSLDGEPSNLFFMIAAPSSGSDLHLEVLSRLSTILMDSEFRSKLLEAKDKDTFLSIVDAKETEKFGAAAKEVPDNKVTDDGTYRVLAVTACPTGIAHTFMAAESLTEKGNSLGISLKAETNGSGGAKNRLTKEEIEACDCIIIAADKNVETSRFDGKPVIFTKVADGIHKPEELIKKAVSGSVPIYHYEGNTDQSDDNSSENFGRSIYKHLMNGVSHMLPFVIGGGILIAIAFLLDDYSIDPKNFGTNTPLAAFFKTVGDRAFSFMLPVLAGFIAMSIADRPGLVAGFVGGALAVTGMTFSQPEGAVSPGFLGALFAGFAAGYLVLALKKLCDNLPRSLEGLKAMLIYPIAGVLLIGIIMCIFNPIIAVLNTGLTNFLSSLSGVSKVVLGCIVGGMMSIDMGGPFNKAAYVFGTAAIESGNYDIMAAVMVGGMVPPIAIALSTLFFKNRYTEKERQSWIVNLIMGFSFITEAAIPYAASDPLRVIPSCIVGSAVAGGLSMFFNCGLRAPHGGIWVIGVISNPFMYLVALAAGSVAGMLMLSLLKKPIEEKK